MEPARAAFGAQRPHALLIQIERFYADALARNNRPRDGASLLRRTLAEQLALDVEDTTRGRIAMTLLAHALNLGGHLEEAESLVPRRGRLPSF